MNTSLTNSTSYLMDSLFNARTSVIIICNQMINFSVGLPLNSYILLLLFTGAVGMDMFMAFVVNQAVAEILLSFVAPLSIMCHVNSDLCFVKPLGFFWGISMSARIIFQCCVCLERYLAVVHPITFLKYNQKRHRVSCSMVAWTGSLAYGIMSIFTFPRLPYSFLGVLYGTILTVELFCCLSILKVLRRPGPAEMEKEQESRDASMNTIKKKAFKIVLINLMIFLTQSIPISATFIFQNKFFSLYAFNLAVAICMLLNIAAGFVHPLFFLQRLGKLTFLGCS